MKHRTEGPTWVEDLRPIFSGLEYTRTDIGDDPRFPVLWFMNWNDIQKFFHRAGLKELLCEDLEELKKAPAPPLEGEIRMMRSFSYGFTVNNAAQRKYSFHAYIWYFLHRGPFIDAGLVLGVAPVGAEGLMRAKMEKLRLESCSIQSVDAIFAKFQEGDPIASS
jgi:hypothetical protein